MITEDIKFIQTKKEGDNLREIQENYPNSFIDVDSQSEKNIYIGNRRITDNYNIGVNENSITNNVGGMTSGINASELKGKSISEILDIILFASNNNLSLKGVVVVDEIKNLTDNTLEDVYQGMVVSVIEDNSLYVLLTDSDEDREWKKVGSDINVEELKTSIKKLSAPITVVGLTGSLGDKLNNKVYTTDDSIEDILRDILCTEIYPDVSLTMVEPSFYFDGMVGAIDKEYKSIMRVGSTLELNSVTLCSAFISSNGYRECSGFTYGYSLDGKTKEEGNPPIKSAVDVKLDGLYTLTETYSSSIKETPRSVEPSEKYEEVKFDASSITIGLGSNIISFTASSPKCVYTQPKYPEYYVVSNLGNVSEYNKLTELETSEYSGILNSIIDNKTISVTGVYPVFVNIGLDSLIEDMVEVELTDSDTFVFDVPSEYDSKIHFKFDYPSSHEGDGISFKIKDVSNNFVDCKLTYKTELIDKIVEGVQYKRLETTGNLQGGVTYKITLSKGLDQK